MLNNKKSENTLKRGDSLGQVSISRRSNDQNNQRQSKASAEYGTVDGEEQTIHVSEYKVKNQHSRGSSNSKIQNVTNTAKILSSIDFKKSKGQNFSISQDASKLQVDNKTLNSQNNLLTEEELIDVDQFVFQNGLKINPKPSFMSQNNKKDKNQKVKGIINPMIPYGFQKENQEVLSKISSSEEDQSKQNIKIWGGPDKNAQLKNIKKRAMSRRSTKVFGADDKNKKLAGLDDSDQEQSSRGMQKQYTLSGSKDDLNQSLNETQEISRLVDTQQVNTNLKQKTVHHDLRGVFIKQYGVTMEFPVYYYQDAKLVPHYQGYIVEKAFHIIPSSHTFTVQNTYLNRTYDETTFDEIYKNHGQSMILALQKAQGRKGFELKHEIMLNGVQDVVIQFSKSGKRFAIYIQKQGILRVFDSQDIFKCFNDIENQKYILQQQIDDESFSKNTKIVFCQSDGMVALVSDIKVLAYSLIDETFSQEMVNYCINLEQYTCIHDININSKNIRDFQCVIACSVDGAKQIHIFDINSPQDVRSVAYIQKPKEIVIKISDDFKSVIFSTGVEHYMLRGKKQDSFPWIKDKTLRNVINHNKSFYLVTSKDYDRDIDILHSDDKNFNASLKRCIEPGLMQVFDSKIITENVDSINGHMVTLMKVGDKLYYDTIDTDLCDTTKYDDEEAANIGSCQDWQYSAYGFNWPYFSYGTKMNRIIVLNAFNPTFAQRYILPDNVARVWHTFLSDTHDLYAIIETQDQKFQIFHIDLDDPEPYLIGPIFQYEFKWVEDKICTGFLVRGSSSKEKINLNKSLITYMMHQDVLYAWTGKYLELIDKNAHNMYYLSDDAFFYMTTEKIDIGNGKKVEHSQVFMIESQFGSYSKSFIYKDQDKRAEILNFGVDNTKKRLILLTGIKNHKDKRDKFITIYDINSEKVMYSLMVESREIIGRLKSNLYNFVEGHIYYGNNVIKIRYDLLERNQGIQLKENQLFDYYSDILSLKNKNYFVQSGTPLQTCLYNKLAFLIRNIKEMKPRQLLILPYLHERKIYLNRRHNTNQFYTLVDHGNKTYILCLCLSDNKMYIYTETGILKQKVPYNEIAEQCGKPQAISENGSYLLFRKSIYTAELYVVKISIYGLEIVNTINLIDKVKSQISQLEQDEHNNNLKVYWEKYCLDGAQIQNLELSFCMNDYGDVLISIKAVRRLLKEKFKELVDLAEFNDDQIPESQDKNKIFFYIGNDQTNKNGEYIYFYCGKHQGQENMMGFSMNENFIFFWNLEKVWTFNLFEKKFGTLNFYVSGLEIQTYIKKVRTGSNEDIVCIRVTQTPIQDCIIVWDLKKNLEIQSFDVDSDALFFQDRFGDPFIAERDYIINCKLGCKLKSYGFRKEEFTEPFFGFQYGHRVEDKSHNWIIFRNFINLSFSYMTFVIKDNFDKCGYIMEDFLFDIEGYDFVLYKNTIFTEGTLVKQEYEKLLFILKSYRELDPVLLEQLHYPNKYGKTPLHLAVEAKNNRMVNLILQYMSYIDFSAVELIKDIYKDLINYQQFYNYLIEGPFQTVQMLNKQTLVLEKKDNDDQIVQINTSSCAYVDEDYFKRVFQEDTENPNYLTFAVKIQAIRADWIMNNNDEDFVHGMNFLMEILRQQKEDIVMTPYMKIVIHYLYKQYSKQIKKSLMPPYIVQLLSFLIFVFMDESIRENQDQNEEIQKVQEYVKKVALVLQTLTNLINMRALAKQSYNLRLAIFRRLWSIVDFIMIVLTWWISLGLFIEQDSVTIRVVESFLVLVIFFKSLYFLSLIGRVAPLVDIIFVIMREIRYFMIIYFIALFALIISYFLIGKNQEYYAQLNPDGLSEKEVNDMIPSYSHFLGACHHVYTSSFGDFDTDSYFDNPMETYCIILFMCLTFFLCVHLLNMLIAIMGETFSQNNQVAEAKRRIQQLAFVVDNWWIDPIKEKEKIVYIVSAQPIEDSDNKRGEKFEEIQNQIQRLEKMQIDLMQEVKSLNYAVGQMQQ